MPDAKKVPPLTDEEILWLRMDKKRAEAWGLVWNTVKHVGGGVLLIIAAYWALWDSFVKMVESAKS